MSLFSISGNIVDIINRNIFAATINVENGMINSIIPNDNVYSSFILPGFIDAHIHIESSMLVPSEFAKTAVTHGTIATVSDPHEIANVCGKEGVHYMIENSKTVPFKFFFGAPSCVPATTFETAGAVLDSNDVAELLAHNDIWYLSEMMNYPGVLFKDPEVMAKIEAAKTFNKPIDGHAPGLRGTQATEYANAGISTDHECFTIEEAIDKIAAGMKIIIREGSAARNYDALHSLLSKHPDKVMFCSDDKHPDELILGHINETVKRSIANGHDLFDVLRAASFNPVEHYKLPVGLLRMGDSADFIVVDDLKNFHIQQTYINGIKVAENGISFISSSTIKPINNFNCVHKTTDSFAITASSNTAKIRVIDAIEGQLVTNCIEVDAKIENGVIVSDIEHDILKICVVNRYMDAPVTVGFIKNFGLLTGAIASTVGHDCHNIIAVGTTDNDICSAVNALIDSRGGISVVNDTQIDVMPLPIAGLMTDKDGEQTGKEYGTIDAKAKELGTKLKAPFMTLSFMALLVIPSLKLSDKGLFDGNKFEFVPVEV